MEKRATSGNGHCGWASSPRQLDRTFAKLSKLRRKQPLKCGARQILLGAVMRTARSKFEHKKKLTRSTCQGLVRTYNKKWKGLNSKQKERYVKQVAAHQEQKLVDVAQGIDMEMERARGLREQLEQASQESRSLRMSDCRWTDAEKTEFQDLYASGEWSLNHVSRLRRLSMTPAAPPPPPALALLKGMEVMSHSVVCDKPDWLGWVCEHRDFFRRCIFKLCRHAPGGEPTYKIIFAQQNPQLLVLMEVLAGAPMERQMTPSELFSETIEWDKSFECQWAFRFSDDGVFDGISEVKVLTDMVHSTDGRLHTDSDWQSLGSLEELLPKRRPGARRSSNRAPAEKADADWVPEAWLSYPAMWEFLREPRVEPEQRQRRVLKKSAPNDPRPVSQPLQSEDALEALVRRRAEVGESDQEWRRFFVWKLRGGTWAGAMKGIAFDCYAAYTVKDSGADLFVASYGNLRQSAPWSIRMYGDREALTLAKAWIHRLFYFFNIWQGASECAGGAHQSSMGDAHAYQEPPEFSALAEGAQGAFASRVKQIRSMVPA